MNILLIGNGFDLAHRLPTKYGDFLSFIKIVKSVVVEDNFSPAYDSNFNIKLQEILESDKENDWNDLLSYRDEWKTLVENNVWIDYFLQCPMYEKENWIDFEKEISKVIQTIDNDINAKKYNLEQIVDVISNRFFNDYFIEDYDNRYNDAYDKKIIEIYNKCGSYADIHSKVDKFFDENPLMREKEYISYKQLILRLQMDLDKLIRALEIYLEMYVKKIFCKNLQKDIEKLNIDHVLSFNYTDTYERLYDNKNVEYSYIHGKANIKNRLENNNMVLGIDEYLKGEDVDNDINFVSFKKYYQRIVKDDDNNYMIWINDILFQCQRHKDIIKYNQEKQLPYNRFSETESHKLYIFGHSLDITDKDIIKDLILNDNVYTTIYYYSKDEIDKTDLKNKVANLIKIIGKNNLIKRTGGTTKTIEFKMQQN